MDIFKLVGSISVENEEANKNIDETADKAESGKTKIGTFLSAVGKGASEVAKFTGKALVEIGKVTAVAVSAGATALTALTKGVVDAYADYEQLSGGVETLFGDSADKVMEYAKKAYKTAGMSANDYMETVTGFSASLLQGLEGDTEKATELADLAITDMSDNANKMGTSMESIQNAYAGFAKGNFTMLDNLKLGYGGTQEEMVRLMNDSGVLEEQITSMDGITFDKMIEAIHAVQTEMDITGTTAKEATETISGSVAMTKASWQNLITSLGEGNPEEIRANVGHLVNAGLQVVQNAVPVVKAVLESLPQVFSDFITMVTPLLSLYISEMLPPLIEATVALLQGIVDSLPQIISMIMNILPDLVSGFMSIFVAIVSSLPDIINPILEALPSLITDVILPAILDNLPAIIVGLTDLVFAIVENLPSIILALVEAIPTIFEKLIEAGKKAFPMIIAHAKEMWGNLKDKAKEAWEGVKETWQPVTDWFKNIFENVKNAVTTAVTTIKTKVTTIFTNIKTTVTTIWNNIKTAITTPIENAKEKVKEIIDAIKGFFDGLDISLPDIKMPHFSVSGEFSLNPISVPHLSISWYKKAMEQPVMFTEPTIFSTANGLKGAGEAGDEVMLGKDMMMSMIQSAVAQENTSMVNGLVEMLRNILTILQDYFPELTQRQLVLDSGAMVGALAPAMNMELGSIYKKQRRGV